MEPRAIVAGRAVALADAVLPVTDDGVARGDGAFETVGVWDGRPFRLEDHLGRLAASLAAIHLPCVDFAAVKADVEALLADCVGDAAMRIYCTASGTRVVTLSPQPQRAALRVLVPLPAPWIRPPGEFPPAGAKTMSYGPNMTATRAARAASGDDALLLSNEGYVLEGPTFCVLWVIDGVLHTAGTDLGIIDSISRRTLLEIAAEQGVAVRTGAFRLDELANADEVLVCSSIRDVIAVEAAGPFRSSGQTPVRDRLSAALAARRRAVA